MPRSRDHDANPAPGISGSMVLRIAALPGGLGWWKSASQDAFRAIAADLAAHGYTDDEAFDILQRAWAAVADEFS